MKKLFALFLAGCMTATLLAGCNGNNGPGGTGPATPSASQGGGEKSGDTNQGNSGKGGKIVLWDRIFEDWNREYFEAKAEQYNQAGRHYTVEQEFVDGDAWDERLSAAQASNSAPDTYSISYNQLNANVKNEVITSLEGLMPQEALDDILDSVIPMVSVDGKIYAYPQLVEPSTVLYYRKDLFEAAGIKEAPKTWDDLLAAAKALNTSDMFGLGISAFADMGWNTWGWQIGASGHLAINDDWDTPTIDDGYKDLALFWKSLYDEGVVPEQPLEHYNSIKAYGEESLAMQFSGSWAIAELMETYPEIAEVTGVASAPTKDGQPATTATNGGWAYVIDAQSELKEGAADYMFWLLGDDPSIPAEFFEIAKYAKAAPRKSVQEYINAQDNVSAFADVIGDIASRAVPEPVYPWDISMAVANMFESVAMGYSDVDAAMAECIQEIQDVIDNEKIAGTNPQKQ